MYVCVVEQSYMGSFVFTVYMEIFARRKFSPIPPSALIGEIFITGIFCTVLIIRQYLCMVKYHLVFSYDFSFRR